MKCGETTLDGRPCPANATKESRRAGHPRCPMHGRNAKEYQRRGAIVSRLRGALPPGCAPPVFDSREAIVRWAEDMAGRVLRGELDPKLSAEARGHAQLALQARTAEAQEKLVEALLSLEHGGTAVALLAQFTSAQATNKRTPIPSRLTVVPAPEAGPA